MLPGFFRTFFHFWYHLLMIIHILLLYIIFGLWIIKYGTNRLATKTLALCLLVAVVLRCTRFNLVGGL